MCAYCFPALDATALDDVSDSVLIHLLELVRAASVEFLELNLILLKFGIRQVRAPQLERQRLLLLQRDKQG